MFTPPNMSYVMCHVSRVTCHVSHVTCHMSHVTCHLSHVKIFVLTFFIIIITRNIYILFFNPLKKNLQSGGASRWRVCYQRGLPRLVCYAFHICSIELLKLCLIILKISLLSCSKKHRKNRKTLPFKNLFGCQYVKVVFTKNF